MQPLTVSAIGLSVLAVADPLTVCGALGGAALTVTGVVVLGHGKFNASASTSLAP